MSGVEIVLTVLASAGGTGVILAGLAAWLGKVWADRIAQSARLLGEIDLDLRKKRVEAYAPLWRATALLPKWPRAPGLTYEDLYRFSGQLRAWYFEVGGMFLSRSTHRDGYGPLQDAIAGLHKQGKAGPLDETDYDAIRDKCSALRTGLANDIESRREGPA